MPSEIESFVMYNTGLSFGTDVFCLRCEGCLKFSFTTVVTERQNMCVLSSLQLLVAIMWLHPNHNLLFLTQRSKYLSSIYDIHRLKWAQYSFLSTYILEL